MIGPMILIVVASILSDPGRPADASPDEVGLDPARLDRIDGVIARAIEGGQFPGAVVLIGRGDRVAFARAYGRRAVMPTSEPITRDTIFDMASLTKPVATATSAMVLWERGEIRLDEPITTYLPEYNSNGKAAIRVEHLLRHRAGLVPDNPLADYAAGPDVAWAKLAAIGLEAPPGERFVYSDVGFEILGRLVERVGGLPLDQFARRNVFEPLGMADTEFRPPASGRGRIAPTERGDGRMLRGEVHDPRARALGGVAGHAGLFSTADDLATYAMMLLAGGKARSGRSILGPMTVRRMIDPGDTPAGQRRGLGWDVATSFSGPRGGLFGPTSFGHTGFTGTSLWVDPETRLFVIVLTSRLHPDGKGGPGPTRSAVATIAASAVLDAPIVVDPEGSGTIGEGPPPIRPVDCGIDVLVRRRFDGLVGKRVGLVTNQTGRSRSGESTIDVLHRAEGVRLVRLFSPEHGIRGLVDAEVADSKDERTGLPIVSLYGKSRRPSATSLDGLDVLVYDIQDIGTRFYTYISTLGLVMEEAAARKIPLVVLDRPNPIGGTSVAGPVRDPDFGSFIAYHALPVRHGMTVGELALLFNAERSIGADLTVVPCEGWRRADLFDRTGLTWVNPSPNMRGLTEALLYPGIGLLEATDLATGRGTDTPFERIGAPWIDPARFASALDRLGLPGVRFVPIRFTPTERQHAGRECGGVQVVLTDWSSFEPVGLGIGIATVLQRDHPDRWNPKGLLRMLADRDGFERLLSGADPGAIRASWTGELAEFGRVRGNYLIYR